MSSESRVVTGELVPSPRDPDYVGGNGGALDVAAAPAPVPAQAFDVRRIVRDALRGRYILALVLGVITGGLFGALAWKMARPVYSSEGIVRIAYSMPSLLQDNEGNRQIPNFEQFMLSQRMVITSRRVIEMATQDPVWRQRGREAPLGLESYYADNLKVDIRPRSEFISISVTDTDPGMAAAAVVALVNAYADYYNTQEKHVERQRLGVLEERQQALQSEINQLSDRLHAAAKEYGSTRLDALYEAAVGRLTRLDTEIANVKLTIAAAPSAVATASPVNGGSEASTTQPTTAPAAVAQEELTPDEISITDQGMRTYIDERERVQGELKRYEALRFGEAHRDVIAARQALATVEERITRYAGQYRKFQAATAAARAATAAVAPLTTQNAAAQQAGGPVTARSLENLRASEASLSELHAKTKQEVAALGNRQLELLKLEGDVNARREEHRTLTRRIDVLRAEGSLGGRLSVLSSGEVGVMPVRDTRLRNAAAGGFVGVTVPAALLIALGFVRRRYRFSDETEADLASSVPLLGILPEHDGKDPAASPAAAHSVHQIRVSLASRMTRHYSHVYLVTSATAGEGKTTVAASLALSFAAAKVKTLLIDCDLVGRHLTSSLDGKDMEGVLEALEQGTLLKSVRKTQSGLYVLTAGKAAASDAVTIPSESIRAIFAEARKYFRVIIVDSGPILGSLEAAVVAQEADGIIFTISRGQHRELVQRSLRRLSGLGTQIVGFIFNRAKNYDFHRSSYASSSTEAANAAERDAIAAAPAWDAESLKRFSPLVQAVASGIKMSDN